jgi:unsaturated chondroitin disaccharide hydrolase
LIRARGAFFSVSFILNQPDKLKLKSTFDHNGPAGANAACTAGKPQLERAFDLCVRKTRGNIKRMADEPRSYALAEDGNYFEFKEDFYDIGNWTSSFFTGMALIAWQQTEDESFLQHLQHLASWYHKKVHERSMDTMHDLGFLYSLYSVALYKLTGDPGHRGVGLRAAEVLAERFNPAGRFIRAWGRMDDPDPLTADMTIIDCLMNLPLLYWASEQTGENRFRDLAIAHADTVLKTFVRSDDSVYHAYRFDLKTGKPVRGDTYGGCAVESHWARGTAWAIYGYALSYRHTRDRRYLEVALRLAHKFIANLDEEVVPVWDFRLPPGAKPIRDASAGSIAICGMQELLKHEPGDALLASASRRLLVRLCAEDNLDFRENCPGLLKYCMIGDGVGKAKNAYTSWGDYYLMEALAWELFQTEPCW